MGNVAILNDIRREKKPLGMDPVNTEFIRREAEELLRGLGIPFDKLPDKHRMIMRNMALGIPEVIQEVERITGERIDMVDIKIILSWYYWGLSRGMRKIDDIITDDDCVRRIRNFCVRKLGSLRNFRASCWDKDPFEPIKKTSGLF